MGPIVGPRPIVLYTYCWQLSLTIIDNVQKCTGYTSTIQKNLIYFVPMRLSSWEIVAITILWVLNIFLAYQKWLDHQYNLKVSDWQVGNSWQLFHMGLMKTSDYCIHSFPNLKFQSVFQVNCFEDRANITAMDTTFYDRWWMHVKVQWIF